MSCYEFTHGSLTNTQQNGTSSPELALSQLGSEGQFHLVLLSFATGDTL